MYKDALDYISAFAWAPPIRPTHLAVGIGGVVGLFFVEFDFPIDGSDDTLWVVVGDLPSAYFVVDNAADSAAALRIYCKLMVGWRTQPIKEDRSPTGSLSQHRRRRVTLSRYGKESTFC